MGRIAFVFSGQGDQYPGMGKLFYDSFPTARDTFRRFEELRPGTIRQCFSGTEEELKETANTQPCLYTMELASALTLMELGIRPDTAAGFSLGECSAAAVAGIMSPEAGFRLVMKRGELMQQASSLTEMSMAAVLKLSHEETEEICRSFDGVYAVNFNCPNQTTVSARTKLLPELLRAVKEKGGRALPLKVKGGFHSPMMKPAGEAFLEELKKEDLNAPSIPLYSNCTGRVYDAPPAELLSRQIYSPVLWEESIRAMIRDGIQVFYEIGPGNTLSNMIRKIDDTVSVYALRDFDTWKEELSLC